MMFKVGYIYRHIGDADQKWYRAVQVNNRHGKPKVLFAGETGKPKRRLGNWIEKWDPSIPTVVTSKPPRLNVEER